jgi:hypothetical protein
MVVVYEHKTDVVNVLAVEDARSSTGATSHRA